MVQVFPGAHDVQKFLESKATYRTSSLVRCQIPRHDRRRVRSQRPEVSTASEIGGLTDHLWLAEEGITAWSEFCGGV